jgi:Ca-activated chloride channel family protein
MRSFTKFLMLFALLLSGLVAVAAQTPAPKASPTPAAQEPDGDGGRVRIREVRVPVTVLDGKKQPVSGLTQGDFVVMEDKTPQAILSFSDEKSNPPVYVAVLMDTSPSTAGKLKFEKEAAKNFIYSVMRLRKDQAAFVTFDHEVNLRQDFTTKQDLLDKAVDSVKTTGTHTALYDAVWQMCDEKMRTTPGRRVIVVITDGEDTYSRARLDEAIDLANRTETTIFAVSTKAGFLGTVPGVGAGTVKDDTDKKLERLARETGGEVFFTGDILDLEKAFTRISKELRSQYVLRYRPSNDRYDGTERKIEVRLANQNGDYKIRAKKSYRAVNDNINKP